MNTAAPNARLDPRERDIQKAAYFLWQELGRPTGHDAETWFAARERLRHRAVTSRRIPAGPPARPRPFPLT